MKVNIGPYKDEDREVKIKIDDYDLWNLDHTLSIVILECLKKFREDYNGVPWIDVEDLPENMQATFDKSDDDDTRSAYEYVLDEMIWAFNYIADEENISQTETNTDIWKDNSERCQKGLILFGKYFRSLWT